MLKKLIFLHIPKSGGSSQRTIFFDLYGRGNVYWHGAHKVGINAVEDTLVVGGHRRILFYPPDLDALFTSVVREPVDRIVSLFSYYVRPDFAESEPGWIQERERQREKWLERGMDPESIVRSVESSPQFREHIRNEQCAYLSRYEPTFAGVLQTLEEKKFVIGDQNQSRLFNEHLSDLLNWGEVTHREVNRSRKSGNLGLTNEPGLLEVLGDLVEEDYKLYRYVTETHQGLYSNVDADKTDLSSLIPIRPYSGLEDESARINVFTKGFIGIDAEGVIKGALVLINHATHQVGVKRYPQLSLLVSLYTASGEAINGALDILQPLNVELAPREMSQWELEIKVPHEFIERAHSIRVRAILDPAEKNLSHIPLLDGCALILRV